VLFGPVGKPGLAGLSPGSPLGDAPVPIVPGVEVLGTPATGGAVDVGGDVALEPVVVPVPVDGLVTVGGTVEPGAGVVPGDVTDEPGAGVAPRLEPAGPLVPPAVCALACPANARSATMAKWCSRIGILPLRETNT
jgi:hypothetical protein